MAYIPDPNNADQPTEQQIAKSTAAEFRALKGKVNALQGVTVNWNPADASTGIVLSGGNLITTPAASLSATSFASTRATTVKSTGKWYYEITLSAILGVTVGLATINANLETGAGAEVFSWAFVPSTGQLLHNGVVVGTTGVPLGAGATVGFAFDLATGDVRIVWSGGAANFLAVAGLAGATVYPIISVTKLTTAVTANFGAAAFSLGPPAGYFGLFNPDYTYSENPNLLINGSCVIDQQNAGTVQNPIVSGQYATDGWLYFGDVAAKFKAQQNLNAVTPPAGYANYQGFETIAAYVPGVAEAFWTEQRVEGYNTVALAFGSSKADPVTLTFQVYASQAGYYTGVLMNGANDRVYPFLFQLTAANTWQEINIAIPGDLAGTWTALTTGVNLKLRLNLGAGANRLGVEGAWAATANNVVGAPAVSLVHIVSTLAAKFYFTGVRLRRGLYTQPQPRELITYEAQLAACMRYYQKTDATINFGGYLNAAAVTQHNYMSLPVTMRQAPVVSTTFAGTVNCTPTTANISARGFTVVLSATAAGPVFTGYSSGNTFDARL